MDHARYQAILADVSRHFARNIDGAEMTVLRNDGLYRHVRFKGRHFTWFDLVTWPGALTIRGSHGTYTFARCDDMFQFFRASNGVNVDYWAEKLPGGRDSVKVYAPEVVPRLLIETYREYGNGLPRLQAEYERAVTVYDATPRERRFPFDLKGPKRPLVKPPTVAELRQQVRDAYEDGDLDYEDGARRLLSAWDSAGVTSDSWELDLREYDFHFVWSCHAIAWGIRQYDEAKAAALVGTAA